MAISSAEKALIILKAFSSNDYELGNLELSEKLGFPTSTVNRLLHILESSGFLQKNPANKKTVHMCTRLYVFSWHPDHLIVTRNQVKQMHAAGIKVFPYNVNTIEDYTRLMKLEVDGVITNDPLQAGVWSRIRKAA